MNTCSIKFLPKAHIGNSIRMTKDKSTSEFDNKPMTGLKIIGYSKLGFRIEHESLPKTFWVDFDQLPLTRLTIKNGVIEDEITFVENFVNHQMQLIRTLDTEYIDLIYATKELDKVEEKITSVLKATPGEIYKGARCKDGTEMIFLGNFYVKSVMQERNWWRRSGEKPKFLFSDGSPRKAFFAMPYNYLNDVEVGELENKFDCGHYNRPDFDHASNIKNSEYQSEYDHRMLMWEERNQKCKIAKQELLDKTPIRYKIIDYPITSKVIKNLIPVDKSDAYFNNIDTNDIIINQEIIKDRSSYHYHYKRSEDEVFNITLKDKQGFEFIIVTAPTYTKVFQSKTNIDGLFEEFVKECGNKPVEYLVN